MLSRDHLYQELNFKEVEDSVLEAIEEGLRTNQGQFRYYYDSSTPISVLQRVSNTLKEEGYTQKTGITIGKGKYLEVIL